MFSPILLAEVEVESCDAHLIPEALGSRSTIVTSERLYDNLFGTLNDSKLVKYVRNIVDETKDVCVEFFDDQAREALHKSSIRTKTTIVDGARGEKKGEILLGHLASNLKARIGLGIGSLMKVTPYSPSDMESSRIGLSMLHSAYLTMYYHFGREYLVNRNLELIRRALADAVSDSVTEETFRLGFCLFRATSRFAQTYMLNNYLLLCKDYLSKNSHPVAIWRWPGFSSFCVLLPYDNRYTALCLLPGFGEEGARGYEKIIQLLAVDGSIPIAGSKVIAWNKSSGLTSEGFWVATNATES